MSEQFASIGAGLVGRAWAIVFARGGKKVRVTDASADALKAAEGLLDGTLADMQDQGLIASAAELRGRIDIVGSLDAALDGAVYVQESVFETVEVKREIFAAMDPIAAPDTILASSSTAIRASRFTEEIAGRNRCLVAHPVNPPNLVPVVEISPAPWTDDAVAAKARAFMEEVGMVPIAVKKEIDGFILNRLQVAVLNEAFKLITDDYVSADDLDKVIKDGLGYRWSFMGPMETIDLTAPNGIRDYIERFSEGYLQIANQQSENRPWDEAMISKLEGERRKVLAKDKLGERSAWRDKRLMAFVSHKQDAEKKIGG